MPLLFGFLVFIIKVVDKFIYDYNAVYINTFHAELIKKYLFKEVQDTKEIKKEDNKTENKDECSKEISLEEYRKRNKYLFFWGNSIVFWFNYYIINFFSLIKGCANTKLNRINDLNKRNELLKNSCEEAKNLNDENIKKEIEEIIKHKQDFANEQMKKLLKNKKNKEGKKEKEEKTMKKQKRNRKK